MGGDGGSIPKRGDVVRTAGYKFVRNLGGMGYTPNTQIAASDGKFGKNELRNLRWSRCAISEEPLSKPIAVCRLGQLYNKENVIKRLLSKTMPKHAHHIKSLKDIKELKDVKMNTKSTHIICPASLIEFEGGAKGFALWSCGCVISEKALKNTRNTEKQDMICINCGKPYTQKDLISLLPDDNELQEMIKIIKKQSEEISEHTEIKLKRKHLDKDKESVKRRLIV